MPTFSASSFAGVTVNTTLQVRLLGEFSLSFAGESVHDITTLRQQSILAYLLLHRHAPQSRRQLAFSLWPDSTESQARTNLRRELHKLRQSLPAADQYLAVAQQTLQWRPDAPLTLDVAAFEEAVAAARQTGRSAQDGERLGALTQAVALYKGDLLPGCYDDWLLEERERLRQDYLWSLAQLVGLLQEQGETRAAIERAQQLLRADPLAEETYVMLIELYAMSGDRARALRTYHSCVTTLQRELGVEPALATRQAYERLLLGAAPPQTPRAPAPALVGASPLVGRQAQLQTLQSCWRQAEAGSSQFVAVGGDAGIGKTRLVEELVDWATRQGITAAQARCYASELELPYGPVVGWLQSPRLRTDLQQLDDVRLAHVARLVPELLAQRPTLPAPEAMTESWQRQQFFEALARALFVVERPLLLLIDDLQWTDQETLAWLHYLLRYASQLPLLVVAAIRSAELESGHPLTLWLAELRKADRLTEIELGPLDEQQTALLAEHIAGAALSEEDAARLYAETEGNPLYTVETVRVRAGQSADAVAGPSSLPPKIQAVVESRLAQLSPAAQRVANLAAAIGRAFTFDVLAAASQEDEDALVTALDELWQRRIIREQSEADYDFSHNKIREVVYNRLSGANRRLLHRRIAAAMERVYAANRGNMSQQIARQYEAAGDREQAIANYRRAGQAAQQMFANADAIRLYSGALTLLATMPEGRERDEQELDLQRMLAIAYRNRQGYAAAEVGRALSRARILCQQLERSDALGPVLWGLYTYHFVRANLAQARALSEELFVLARERQEPIILQQAHYALAGTLCSLGDFETSRQHFEAARALYRRDQHQAQVAMFGVDLGVFCLAWSSHALWHLGHLQEAHERSDAALRLASELGHPFSQALAMAYATMLQQFGRDGRQVLEWATATITFCAQHGVGYYDSWATILLGWARAERGSVAAGIEQMRAGLERFRASDSETRLPYYLGLLAEACAWDGQLQEARRLLDEALQLAAENGDAWFSAETYRLMARLHLQSGERQLAEICLHKSLDVSRRQLSTSLELRAALELARLSPPEEARRLLAPILAGFAPDAQSGDILAARELLAETP